jgi:ribulose-phosphate 3-epimerase
MIDVMAPAVILEVDGGITAENIRSVSRAGVDVFVAGAAVFGHGDYRDAIRRLKEA